MNRQSFLFLVVCSLLMYSCSSEKKNTTTKEHRVTQNTESMDNCNLIYAIADTIYETGDTSPKIINLKILYNQYIIFSDSDLVYETGIQYISYHDSIHYALFNFLDPISARTLCVLRWTSPKNVTLDRVIGTLICDIDDDDITEIIGQEYTDAVCINCDSCYYSPIYVWKLQEICAIDEKLTQELTSLKFGCYLGLHTLDTVLQCCPVEYNSVSIW